MTQRVYLDFKSLNIVTLTNIWYIIKKVKGGLIYLKSYLAENANSTLTTFIALHITLKVPHQFYTALWIRGLIVPLS